MTPRTCILLLIYVIGMSAGQFLFKISALKFSSASHNGKSPMLALLNWHFISAIALYALLTIYWVWLLSFTPLAKAYPFVALSIAITVIAGWKCFGEHLSIVQALGCLFIFIGVTMMAWERN